MTKQEFIAECEARLLAPAIALDDDAVREALEAKDDDAVRAALDNNF